MWSNRLGSTIALLLLGCRQVSASDVEYRSFGQVTSCQNDRPANTTSFNVSISPSNATLAFDIKGLPTIPGNATLSFVVLADGDEVYKTMLDPCIFPIPDLCPASGEAANLTASMRIPENVLDTMDLSSRADVKSQLSLDITGTGSRQFLSCVETALRSDASNNGNGTTQTEGNGSGNDTSSSSDSGSTNGTADNAGGDTSSATQDSAAGTLQAVSYVAL